MHGFPHARPGLTIGLLGGSFDPPHAGHVHITLEALKRFNLDQVWWLVSPGNPLKAEGPAALPRRLAASRGLMRHPRVVVTDLEARLGTRYTAQTLKRLKQLYPGVRFVWLMGADNLATFHRWENWRWIMENVPIGVFARPGSGIAARMSRAASRYARFRLSPTEAGRLAWTTPPAWCFLDIPMRPISSSQIRARGDWER